MMNKQLIEDNINLVYSAIHKYFPKCIHDEDIVQCGMLGLCKACNTWDESKSTLSTYAYQCIRNEIIEEFKRRNKHSEVWSLDYEYLLKDEPVTLQDILVGDSDVDYFDMSPIYKELTPTEQLILKYRQQGLKPVEIGKKLDLSRQSVCQKLRIIRIKWKQIMDDTMDFVK